MNRPLLDIRHLEMIAALADNPRVTEAAEVLRITTELNRRLEAAIRQAPEQWLWLHRRWKTRPPEESRETQERDPSRE